MIELDSIDRRETLRYLRGGGPAGGEPVLAPDMQALLGGCERELLSAMTPRYIFASFAILENSAAKLTEGCGIMLEGCGLELAGRDIRNHLSGCGQAVLLAVTLGNGPDRLIRLSQINDMEKAVVYDAMASVAVDQVCDLAEGFIKARFPGSFFTWRFSPGYGDFPIEIQRPLLTVLDTPRKIGLTATDSALLTPTKSVTAVIGLSDSPISREKRSCAGCNLCETCRFRKGGSHC